MWLNLGQYSAFVDAGGESALPYPLVFSTANDGAGLVGRMPAVVASSPTAGNDAVTSTST